jgi:carbamoyl-phosphate synthase large subunit
MVNIQYIIYEGEVYVIEVNPRASRTVPYLSKVTGVPMCELATKVSLGGKLKDLGYGIGIYPVGAYVAVKVPVFSFEKLADVDTHLGPEMKSTGEVLGLGRAEEEALYKGLIAAGYHLKREGGVFLSVRDSDKGEIAEIARKFHALGMKLYATKGTVAVLENAGLQAEVVPKIHESGEKNIIDLLESGEISYIVSTSAKGRDPRRDSVKIRRRASILKIPCLTSIDTAKALTGCLMSYYSQENIELVDICTLQGRGFIPA